MRRKIIRVLTAALVAVGLSAQTVSAHSEANPAESGQTVPSDEEGVQITSAGGLVMDVETQTVLYDKNGETLYYPASITKLLTALVTVENCSLDETVIFSHDAVYDVEAGSGNNQGFEAGDKLTVEDCLYAMILESSNPAANALAEHTSGSLYEFVEEMNQKAQELGCKNSNFMNPSGLNDEEQKTTPYDMALISSAVFENEELRKICSARTYQLPPTLNEEKGYLLHMEHKLVNGEEKTDGWDLTGGKTGYTSMAGNTLVTYAQEGEKQLVCVVMKSDMTHYEDTRNLLDYGFENYGRLTALQKAVQEEKTAEAQAMAAEKEKAAVSQAEEIKEEISPETDGIPSMIKKAVCVSAAVLLLLILFISHVRRKVRERRRRERLMRRRRQRARQMRKLQQQRYHRQDYRQLRAAAGRDGS